MFIIALCLTSDIIFSRSKPPEYFNDAMFGTEFCPHFSVVFTQIITCIIFFFILHNHSPDDHPSSSTMKQLVIYF